MGKLGLISYGMSMKGKLKELEKRYDKAPKSVQEAIDKLLIETAEDLLKKANVILK